MKKTRNQKAWFMVLPVLILVAFSAIIPLMTVVNYSVQDTFGNNNFFWVGLEWFEEILASDRAHDALGRQVTFTAIILAIEVPYCPSHAEEKWLLVLPLPSITCSTATYPVECCRYYMANIWQN